jgi:hypothetical protein
MIISCAGYFNCLSSIVVILVLLVSFQFPPSPSLSAETNMSTEVRSSIKGSPSGKVMPETMFILRPAIRSGFPFAFISIILRLCWNDCYRHDGNNEQRKNEYLFSPHFTPSLLKLYFHLCKAIPEYQRDIDRYSYRPENMDTFLTRTSKKILTDEDYSSRWMSSCQETCCRNFGNSSDIFCHGNWGQDMFSLNYIAFQEMSENISCPQLNLLFFEFFL